MDNFVVAAQHRHLPDRINSEADRQRHEVFLLARWGRLYHASILQKKPKILLKRGIKRGYRKLRLFRKIILKKLAYSLYSISLFLAVKILVLKLFQELNTIDVEIGYSPTSRLVVNLKDSRANLTIVGNQDGERAEKLFRIVNFVSSGRRRDFAGLQQSL